MVTYEKTKEVFNDLRYRMIKECSDVKYYYMKTYLDNIKMLIKANANTKEVEALLSECEEIEAMINSVSNTISDSLIEDYYVGGDK